MHAQRIKTGLRRLGDVVLKISIGAAMMGLGIWLFTPDAWVGGKSAAIVAFFGMPLGFALYGLTRLVVWIIPDSVADVDKNSN
jgi:hypothetical protein